ncbi:TetR/AcrR family transcriptional regulator [Albimonas sp. CAU 1670]|uniref:TetR/AcrR family transcriptional regulator n=1 Tax=Albimonas sp. CAU 1670 TaxID=3032599 RepID=UPI0023DAE01C|nr:TetR/AcrR family transcriptional regulator [Albimonas sp. CAU 1670]MDF2234080.1 TetR/AcrR family transcriptional regulator [Albimonas sp. CAU 1670]
MARTQSQLYPEIREKILRTAGKLFAEKGFATATILDLAKACDSSRGALYHYFGSKEEILAEIIEGHVAEMLGELEAIESQRLEPEAHLSEVARCIMRLNAVNAHEQVVLLNDFNLLEPELQRKIAADQRKIVAIVRNALARLDDSRRLAISSDSTYAMMLLGILNYTFAWYDRDGPISPEAFADRTVDIFLNGFRSAPRPE